jgi:hypothetical protein
MVAESFASTVARQTAMIEELASRLLSSTNDDEKNYLYGCILKATALIEEGAAKRMEKSRLEAERRNGKATAYDLYLIGPRRG